MLNIPPHSKMAELECFAVSLQTVEGYPMAACGLCREGYSEFWMGRLSLLSNLVFGNSDIFLLDYILADSIKTLANDTLFAAGCTVASHPPQKEQLTTGGVIGLVMEDIASAEDAVYTTKDGFTVGSFSGGPGFVLHSSKTALAAGKADMTVKFDFETDKQMLMNLMDLGAESGIIVSDGTGRTARGYALAFDKEHTEILYL